MDAQQRIIELVRAVEARGPLDAAAVLSRESVERVAAVLQALPPMRARDIASHLPESLRDRVTPASAAGLRVAIPNTVGELMEPALGVLPDSVSVQDAIAFLRASDQARRITYLYAVDADERLSGVVVIRDLLLSRPEQPLSEVMLAEPFSLTAATEIGDAIDAALHRHYPVYPVVDAAGRLQGVIRGWQLFEQQAVEITAQSGRMVGIDGAERVYTGFWEALRRRHPWLQVNLLTAFMAAFVVGAFADTISRVVALAAFLPVLAGQSGNTGSQAMAITLRGLTLGDLEALSIPALVRKEALLGACNGALVGLVAAAAMWAYAMMSGFPDAPQLAVVIWLAMVGSCVASGIFGVLVPVTLRRIGADPATASSIFLTTFTDIFGMGLMLLLAVWLVH
ncbi:magnesium transporter [Sinimarinibacterium sp. CAU 1509]|uniref:magnesium transporter n=1 Tax=Sinimarinibacterium sp. CAU 1509 TaxID=2562283 RepID=UPI0010AC60D6|nr:magnesium transporter [Sinimarinibacterium sp. CAU 1509]TJY59941.1 magnesium transporter [Sinimarinibacterium sp. CAU 1509]